MTIRVHYYKQRDGVSVCERCGMVENKGRVGPSWCSGRLPPVTARQGRADRCTACGRPTYVGEDFGGPCVHDTDLACALAQRDEARKEAGRLRKLFDDAGQGEHNVLALVDHYQRDALEADAQLRAVRALLEKNRCDCECEHHPEDHGDECDLCLACRIYEAVRT